MRYLGQATRDPAVTKAALERWDQHWDEHGYGLLAAEHRATGELVGRAGPQFHGAWPDDPELGWGVDPAWWGQGIATEMGAACVDWALGDLGLERLVSITVEENLASRRVMAKLGFAFLTSVTQPSNGVELWVHSLDAEAARRG